MQAPRQPEAPDPEEIRRLFPHLCDDQLVEAGENIDAYLEVLLGIYERLRNDPDAYRRFEAVREECRLSSGDPSSDLSSQ